MEAGRCLLKKQFIEGAAITHFFLLVKLSLSLYFCVLLPLYGEIKIFINDAMPETLTWIAAVL